ncbi:phospholipase A2 inhibitor NAI-like [Pelodiscus sinensis]|uniref:phospholipase A2 inhibitor NAI-like n=1 Tax=Pelodiscus sinensis TaxID=13735 RepID=UPI003F6D7246
MTASLTVCLLAALLATGACLQCEVCAGLGTDCRGNPRPCPAERNSCGLALTELTWGGVEIQSILKGCMMPSQCQSGPVSVNFGNGMEMKTSFTCCVDDACRATSVTRTSPVSACPPAAP